MSTIRSLAYEFNVHPYGLAIFLDLGADYAETAELDAETENLYREMWAAGLTDNSDWADELEAELDADFGPDDALRETYA